MDSELLQAHAGEVRLFEDHLDHPPLKKIKQDHFDVDFKVDASPLALKSGEEAQSYLRHQHEINSHAWYRKCLVLQRTARGIPARFPTALTAALATPESERVYKVSDLRRGMVAFCDDPNDNNPAGHVFDILGRNKSGNIITWTNDALEPGCVDIVEMDFYAKNWGDTFQFGATMLNGYDFSDFNKPAEIVKPEPSLGNSYANAIDDLIVIRERKIKKGQDKLAAAIDRDIIRMKRKMDNWSKN